MAFLARHTVFAWTMVCIACSVCCGAPWWEESGTGGARQELDEVLGRGAAAAWDFPAPSKQCQYRIERDETLGRDVLVCDGPRSLVLKGLADYPAGVEVACRVRLTGTEKRKAASFILAFGKDPSRPDDRGILVVLRVTRGVEACNVDVVLPYARVRSRLNLKPYPIISPVWEETVRLPLERDMAVAQKAEDTWLSVRCRTTDDWVRIWVQDRLLLELTRDRFDSRLKEWHEKELAKTNAIENEQVRARSLKTLQERMTNDRRLPNTGLMELSLSPGARLAEACARAVPKAGGLYETVALGGYVRDRDLLDAAGTAVADGALPFGKVVTVEGIPFRFVDRGTGPDHLDVGRSLLRQANMTGYLQANKHRFSGAMEVDPARTQLRIPNGRYDTMYVIAAFDEGKGSVPVLSASFYRPNAGFAKVFSATAPSWRAKEAQAVPLPVKLENRRNAKLWLVKMPLSPADLASFSDMDVLEVELTKAVHQFRSYPDPISYGWHQGGPPSGVHVYAVTLKRPEVHMTLEPAVFGHVWQSGETPAYDVHTQNRTGKTKVVNLTLETESHDGAEKAIQTARMAMGPGRDSQKRLTFPVKKFGIHRLRVTMASGDKTWTEQRNFAYLAPDTRAVKWEEGKGPLFGFWSYRGGHYTAPARHHYELMAMAGARAVVHLSGVDEWTRENIIDKHGFRKGSNAWIVSPQRAWAGEEKIDPEKCEAFKKLTIEKIRKSQGEAPEIVSFFPEPHISRNLTAGNLPVYWGDPPYEYNEQEKHSLRVFFNTAKAAAEAVRATWPQTKILIPWGDPLFIPPLLRAGFPKDLIDGSGLDMIGFERLPEQQLHQQSTHRLYCLKEEYRKAGIENPMLFYIEGTFVPTEPGGCTWREQADYYHRWTLLSLAYGITRFYSGWFAFDCGNYYGAEHYGGCGIQRRIPYNDPKPAYAHYATMTRMLDRSAFEKWLPTGSLSTYCLKFRREKGGPVYVLWTLRGKRPVTLRLAAEGAVTVTDAMDNAAQVTSKDKTVTVMTGGSPVYVTGAGDIAAVTVGKPDHADAVEWSRGRNQDTWWSGPIERPAPVAKTLPLASLGDGAWSLHAERDELYETNNYDTKRFPGDMSAKVVTDPDRPGPALAVRLGEQEKERKVMPWYTVLKPKRPVKIPGKSKALGLWVKAGSDWGRVVYCLRDARGERWISTGTRDQWNCDDMHSWSYFCFDGWRYLRFEMPSHLPYDNFREFGTTWWGHAGGDGIVDLPLKLEKIIVERRTHVLYVNDIQPANPADVLLADLVAEYGTEFDATRAAVAQSRIRMRMPRGAGALPNPIAQMAAANELPATRLKGVRDPDWGYDGTRCHVDFDEVEGAVQYQVWVAAYKDGAGAQPMARMKAAGQLLQRLRPEVTLYLWVTYTDKDKKQSKPSNRLAIKLIDAFGQK